MIGEAVEPHTMSHHWITDPAFDDHDLSRYLCGPSAPNAPTCGAPLRNCTYDSVLTSHWNATSCGGACFVCLHKTLLQSWQEDHGLPFKPTANASTMRTPHI